MELWQSKVFSLILLGLGAIVVGLLPLWFTNQRTKHPLLMSSLLCFGGGVLLATSMVHMLPEVREMLPEYKEYAEVLFIGGFFILYLIDEIVHFFYGEVDETHLFIADNHSHLTNADAVSSTSRDRRHSFASRYGAVGGEGEALLCENNRQTGYNPSFSKAQSDSQLFVEGSKAPSQLCHVAHQEPCSNALPIANLGLLVALSMHSLLEGLVIGLEPSATKVLLLLGAISSHKFVVGFCLGIELTSNPFNTVCRHFVSILIFAFGSVLGILIGMWISNVPSDVEGIATPILQGLAGGTLMYVTVSEVLPRERARWHEQHSRKAAGIVQFFSVFSGFCLMTFLSFYFHD